MERQPGTSKPCLGVHTDSGIVIVLADYLRRRGVGREVDAVLDWRLDGQNAAHEV
jgi:hypothetical protein